MKSLTVNVVDAEPMAFKVRASTVIVVAIWANLISSRMGAYLFKLLRIKAKSEENGVITIY